MTGQVIVVLGLPRDPRDDWPERAAGTIIGRVYVPRISCDHMWEDMAWDRDAEGKILQIHQTCPEIHGGCGARCVRDATVPGDRMPIVEYEAGTERREP